jgi:uncharacterized protein
MHARTLASVTSTAVLLLGIATLPPQPVLTAAAAGAGEFVWHDLVTDNPEACQAFYGALLGWTFEPAEGIDPGYIIIKHAGRMIGGIVRPPAQADGTAVVPQWLSYLLVDDVDRTTDAVRRGGGRVYRGPLTARKDVRLAVVGDAQGAPFGLASRGPRDMEAGPPGLHRWLWMEYVAVDTEAALKFYGEVIGFRHEVQETREDFTYYLLTTDRPHAGLFRSIWPRQTSAWLPYVRVADPAAMAARAAELGGSIVLAPAPGVRRGSLAIVLDPTGAPLALQKYPFETGVTP